MLKFVGFQNGNPCFVRNSLEELLAIPCVEFDEIREVDSEEAEEVAYQACVGKNAILKVKQCVELARSKEVRAALVEKATVTVDGMTFDADETSQNRLSRGITAALALGLGPEETTEWTLADNSSAQVTVQQMARALLAAGQYQTSVWRMPYEA